MKLNWDTATRRRGNTANYFLRVCLAPRLSRVIFLFICSLFLASCSQLEKPKTEPFYAQTAPPQKKEFRWSNGKMPKSFDPALASAPPETDIVRAIYEGLTETDAKTLQAVPAIATEWKHSDDFKTWTFILRKDARWSNGERVTAKDFARSWKRLAVMGEKVSHQELLRNIVGLKSAGAETALQAEEKNAESFSESSSEQTDSLPNNQINSNTTVAATPQIAPSTIAADTQSEQENPGEKPLETKFGVEATDNFTLVISLVRPDKDFPVLVAHPIFRPIFGDGKKFEANKLNAGIVTNGAFRVASVGQDGITLDRAEKYWNREAVELERVRFVPTENAEKALEAYRAGEVDAVTNADFEPLALKLLTPYEDFQRTTHSAINLYEFNRQMPPFDDFRVREALAIAIERERITEDEMGGASLPALSFLPFEKADEKMLAQDAARAKNLLAESGFPGGENFPIVKLLVNRNNVQQRVARSVAKMWKQSLNVETEIVVKDSSELAAAWATGEYALLRRGAVLPTANEMANMLAIFADQTEPQNAVAVNDSQPENAVAANGNPNANSSVSSAEQPKAENQIEATANGEDSIVAAAKEEKTILTEEQAFNELPAIPLYFPTSYSLVKPYIQGFEVNILNAPSLKNVR
ncbi:MAG: peptide ABC transporter substrate-binding protein, partial [Acidobacteriota bacterium]|nr:peptide ABC transporter substrate-binding protein [Acidobacteriota bacterium]